MHSWFQSWHQDFTLLRTWKESQFAYPIFKQKHPDPVCLWFAEKCKPGITAHFKEFCLIMKLWKLIFFFFFFQIYNKNQTKIINISTECSEGSGSQIGNHWHSRHRDVFQFTDWIIGPFFLLSLILGADVKQISLSDGRNWPWIFKGTVCKIVLSRDKILDCCGHSLAFHVPSLQVNCGGLPHIRELGELSI